MNTDSLGYVMMLDVSGSMASVIDQVRINSHAFVNWSRVGDQFGINSFDTTARWVYPAGANPDMLTVSQSYDEVKASYSYIEKLASTGLTNIGAAIQLANGMYSKMTAQKRAFVLLSDGEHNTGTDPNGVLGSEPPLYVAGMGYYLKRSYFDVMLAKNPKSKFYNEPDANKMMLMFNDIAADSTSSATILRSARTVSAGRGNCVSEKLIISDPANTAVQLVFNKRLNYGREAAGTGTFAVTMTGADGIQFKLEPLITNPGNCIFRMKDLKPGTYTMNVDCYSDTQCCLVFGGLNYKPSVSAELTAPPVMNVGEAPSVSVRVSGNNGTAGNVSVTAYVESPQVSIDQALEKYRGEMDDIAVGDGDPDDGQELQKLKILREQLLHDRDIIARSLERRALDQGKDGLYSLTSGELNVAGVYNVRFEISGEYEGCPFILHKNCSILVG